MPIHLNALYKWWKEGLQFHTSNDFCCSFFAVVVLHCFDIYERKDMSGEHHETMTSRRNIPFLVFHKAFESMGDTARQDLEGIATPDTEKELRAIDIY